MKGKKGQSLIEVLVSLTILIIVFTAVVTLVLATMNLSFSARNRTEAIALVQTGIADGVVCIKSGRTRAECASSKTVGILTMNVAIEDLSTVAVSGTVIETNDTLKLSNSNFQKITAIVTWRDKGTTTDKKIEVSKVVRR